MKISTLMVVVAVALSFAVSGCKYSKTNTGANGGSGSGLGAAGGSDISTSIGDDQEGPLDGAGVSDRPFEEYCTRCTDVDFAPVYFGFDSTVVPQGEIGKIDEVAQHLGSHADRVVVVEGHHPQLSRPERCRRFPHPDAQLRRGEAGGRRQRRVRVGEEPPRRVRDLPEVIFCR